MQPLDTSPPLPTHTVGGAGTPPQDTPCPPLSVVVMGVCGSGKTAVASQVASRLGWRAVDADDLHAPDAVAKMRAGQALTDTDRWPWLDRVGAVLATAAAQQQGVLVACSALRRVYRDRLRAACPGLRFVFLQGPRELIAQRMAARQGHYMPTSLLDSQLQTLEPPGNDEIDVLPLAIDSPLEALAQQVCAGLPAGAAGGWCSAIHEEAIR